MSPDRLDNVTLSVLADHAPLHVLDIAEQADEHPVAIDLACARLHDRGDICSVGLGRYDITDQGRRRCDGDQDGRLRPEESPP